MLCARLRIQGPAAKFAVPAMGPETGRELPRTETVECIRIIEDIEDLTEMKP